jgi:predicted secreted protein
VGKSALEPVPSRSIGTKKDAMKTLTPCTEDDPRDWSLRIFAAGLLLIGACATPAPPPVRTVTDVDADAGAIDLARGQDLEIALPLNSGTGYAWRLDHEAPSLVLSGGSSFVTDAKAPGAPVRAVYRYTAVARGEADLAFTLKRPWEADQPRRPQGRVPRQGALSATHFRHSIFGAVDCCVAANQRAKHRTTILFRLPGGIGKNLLRTTGFRDVFMGK